MRALIRKGCGVTESGTEIEGAPGFVTGGWVGGWAGTVGRVAGEGIRAREWLGPGGLADCGRGDWPSGGATLRLQ